MIAELRKLFYCKIEQL